MTSSLPSTDPLANQQVDHTGKITFEERVSQSSLNEEWCRTQPPASVIHWDSPLFLPLKTFMAEQNPQSWSLDKSPPSPQIVDYSD